MLGLPFPSMSTSTSSSHRAAATLGVIYLVLNRCMVHSRYQLSAEGKEVQDTTLQSYKNQTLHPTTQAAMAENA